MVKKCPPGVICIENISLIVFILCILFLYIFLNNRKYIFTSHNNFFNKENENINENKIINNNYLHPKSEYSYTNNKDILLNPYTEPLRDNSYFNNNIDRMPINIKTQSCDSTYRQIGILTRNNGEELILPLMGKPLITNRDTWNFYTLNKNNIKLPIKFKNKSCMSSNGCDNIYNGDNVYVEGYNDIFKATIYDNDVMKYIPYL